MARTPGDAGKPAGSLPLASPAKAPGTSDPNFDLALSRIGFAGARAANAPPVSIAQIAAAAAKPAAGQGAPASRALAIDLARRDWLLETQERQRRLSPLAGGLLRTTGMQPQQFLDHFYAPGRPCVIAGAIDHWPALARWTPAYLRETVGPAPVEFQGNRQMAGDFELAKDRHKQRLPFTAYLDLIEQNPGNDAYVTAYNSAANEAAFAPLMADMGDIACCLTPGGGMLWVGPGGTFTPLHFDLTNNLLVQVTGRKQILLVPPAQTHLLAHRRHVFSEVHDLQDEACLARHPQARQVQPFEVTLAAGELLYIPIGWWHQVRSLEFSAMLTYTNFLWPNEGHRNFPGD